MNKKFFIAIMTCIALVSCGNSEKKEKEVKSVNVAQAIDLDKAAPLTFTGRTKAAEDANVAFRVSGPIVRMAVKEGDYVSKGQIIAQMDSRDYELQHNATKAEYEQIKADVERVVALYNEGNTTAQNYDKARYGLEQITQKLNNHRNQLADTKLLAPISGYVTTCFHHAGETVGAGMPIVRLSSAEDLEVEISLSAQHYANRDTFTKFYCKFDITGDQRFPLTISRVAKEANANQLYTVRLKLNKDCDRTNITPGMNTLVYVERASEGADEVCIPATALINKSDMTQVFKYDNATKTVKLTQVTVSTLKRNGDAVITQGLRSGDIVVSTGVHHLDDGEKVNVLKTTLRKTNVGEML